MTRAMYDSVLLSALPLTGNMYAGYIDGSWPNFPGLMTMFPNLEARGQILSITTNRANLFRWADVCDVENGDYDVVTAAIWAYHNKSYFGERPTIYCNRSTYPDMVIALSIYGLEFGRDVDWWCTTLDGTMEVPGAVAIQYQTINGYDQSIVLDDNWHPNFFPVINKQTGDTMPYLATLNGTQYLVDGNTKVVVNSETDGPKFLALPQFMGQKDLPELSTLANIPDAK